MKFETLIERQQLVKKLSKSLSHFVLKNLYLCGKHFHSRMFRIYDWKLN